MIDNPHGGSESMRWGKIVQFWACCAKMGNLMSYKLDLMSNIMSFVEHHWDETKVFHWRLAPRNTYWFTNALIQFNKQPNPQSLSVSHLDHQYIPRPNPQNIPRNCMFLWYKPRQLETARKETWVEENGSGARFISSKKLNEMCAHKASWEYQMDRKE